MDFARRPWPTDDAATALMKLLTNLRDGILDGDIEGVPDWYLEMLSGLPARPQPPRTRRDPRGQKPALTDRAELIRLAIPIIKKLKQTGSRVRVTDAFMATALNYSSTTIQRYRHDRPHDPIPPFAWEDIEREVEAPLRGAADGR